MFETPVLYIIFNRPDLVKTTFARIREIQPKYLFIAADGPRELVSEDAVKCNMARETVLSMIDWDCEVKKLFRDKNLGCGKGPAEAITWFFSHVEAGIILEDDIHASLSFFRYTEELLDRYKHDQRVMGITGFNLQNKIRRNDDSYYFSSFPGIWGWATWATRWKLFDYDGRSLKSFIKERKIQNISERLDVQGRIINDFNTIGTLDGWDFAWRLAVFNSGGLIAVPNTQLVTNLGFDSQSATHTKGINRWAMRKAGLMVFPLVHPVNIGKDIDADRYYCEKILMIGPKEVLSEKIVKLFNRLRHFIFSRQKRRHYLETLVITLKNRIVTNKMYVLGDSHSEVFDYLNRSLRYWKFRFDVTSVGGATALGLTNPNSKTQALELFRQKIDSIEDLASPILFLLGEVDTGFLIWYQAKKRGLDVQEMSERSIRNYMSFIKIVRNLGFKNILVLSAPLPAIRDNEVLGIVANQRREVTATQSERTLLTLNYNRAVELECSKLDVTFLNCDNLLLNPKTQLLSDVYYNSKKTDHHLNNSVYSKIVAKVLSNGSTQIS